MSIDNKRLSQLWDNAFEIKGHTGYNDSLVLNYDQPIRISTIRKILSTIKKKGKQSDRWNVLDIGCGTGDFIKLSREFDSVVTGVDISPKVIENTRARFKNDVNVHLMAAPIVDIEFKEQAFDMITSITVLQHILEKDELVSSLKKLRNSLKDDGYLIVLELTPPHKESVMHYYFDGTPYLLERPGWVWREAFSEAGFKIIEEPVMPQLGISALRGFGYMIGNMIRFIKQKNSTAETSSNTHEAAIPKTSQGSVSKGKVLFMVARKAILKITWLSDYMLRLPLPGRRHRYYGVFVCRKEIV
jgi:ubiquinone/menaquinone biosynthesis C-methylase UbiE